MKWFIAIVVLALLVTTAQAVTITHGSTTIDMDFVSVGNTDNVGDVQSQGTFGAVDYSYNIGTYEVTENQWDAVSGASGTDLLDDPGYWSGDQPVAAISWHEAAMFCNWLTSGDVTDGAYAIDAGGVVTGIDRSSAVSAHGTVYVIPTENEWYKAAYYDGSASTYYHYPTGSDTGPDGIDFNGDATFDVVFEDGYNQGHPNDMDNAGVLSPYGTMGQGGNVEEWNETAFGSWSRGVRGGLWCSSFRNLAASYRRSTGYPTIGGYYVGFRVALVGEQPREPQTYAILVGGTDADRRRQGDLDANKIRDALLRFHGIDPDNVKVETTIAGLTSTMTSVAEKVKPGDTLLFYYGGHGAYIEDDHSESQVPRVLNSPDVQQLTGNEYNEGDELLVFDNGSITDDQLFLMLSSGELPKVNKLVILDSCMSGGFWGKPNNASDVGDLDKLKRVGLIAACTEESISGYAKSSEISTQYGYTGRGHMSLILEEVLKDIASGGSELTFSTLKQLMSERYIPSYIRDNYPGPVAIGGFPWLESEIVVDLDDLAIRAEYTDDFDPHANLVVPEPSTFALTALALLSLAIYASRHRR